jgi:hypothetical protein
MKSMRENYPQLGDDVTEKTDIGETDEFGY